MTAQLSPTPVFKGWDNNGAPLAFGKLFTYIAGTTTKQASYTDSTQTTPNTNPVILNARGEANVWLDPTKTYKLVLSPSTDTDPPTNVIWTVDQINGSLSPSASIIPSVDNVYNLGSATNRWANAYISQQVYVGLNNYPIYDATNGIVGYYARTAAEISAGVTPTNYAYPPGNVLRYGADSTGGLYSTTAFVNAVAVGGSVYAPRGTYKMASGLSLKDSQILYGDGALLTTLVFDAGLTAITLPSSGARNTIQDLTISGTGKTGIGIQVGDTNFSGNHNILRVRITTFATGTRLAGALWTIYQGCIITGNTVGVDFNAGWGAGYSTTVMFIGCRISANDHEGVTASNVPVRNQSITFIGGSIDQNCVTDLTRYQHVTGAVEQLSIINVYYEYAAAGTKPNGINLDNAGPWTIQDCYFNTLNYGIHSVVTSQGRIDGCRFVTSSTKDIFLSGGVNVSDIEIGTSNSFSAAGNTLAGNNVIAYTSGISKAQQVNINTTWTPTLKGASVAGTPTYGTQAASYSKIGNLVTFKARVTISAKGGMTGAISLEGLPIAAATLVGTADIFPVDASGVTVSASNTYLYAQLSNGGTSLLLWEGGSTSNQQIADTNLAAATTIQVSGCYQAAS